MMIVESLRMLLFDIVNTVNNLNLPLHTRRRYHYCCHNYLTTKLPVTTATSMMSMMVVKTAQIAMTTARMRMIAMKRLAALPTSSYHHGRTTIQLGGIQHQRSLWSRPASVMTASTATTSSSNSNRDHVSGLTTTTTRTTTTMKPHRRTLVRHAGHVVHEQAESLADEIRQRQRQMTRLIRELPRGNGGVGGSMPTTKATTTTTTTTACSSPSPLATIQIVESLERILFQEETILQLCQQYKSLTGEDVDEDVLPMPNNDESATVRRIS